MVAFQNEIEKYSRELVATPLPCFRQHYRSLFRYNAACNFVANLGYDPSKDGKFTIVVDSISIDDILTDPPNITIFIFAKNNLEKFATNYYLDYYPNGASIWMDGASSSTFNVAVKPEYANDNLQLAMELYTQG